MTTGDSKTKLPYEKPNIQSETDLVGGLEKNQNGGKVNGAENGNPQNLVVVQNIYNGEDPAKYDNANGYSYCCCSSCTCCCNYIASIVFCWIFAIPLFICAILGMASKYDICFLDTSSVFDSIMAISIVEFILFLAYSILLCLTSMFNTKSKRIAKSAIRLGISGVIFILCLVIEFSLTHAVSTTLSDLNDDDYDPYYKKYDQRKLKTFEDEIIDCAILYVYGLLGLLSFSFIHPIILTLVILDIIRLVRTVKEKEDCPENQFGKPTSTLTLQVPVQPVVVTQPVQIIAQNN